MHASKLSRSRLARGLVAFLIAQIVREGSVPILHVKGENNEAKRLYEKLGFHVRRAVQLTVISRG